jgi:DNA-directed RNA polymerase specialized sigma24 family protein
VLGATEAVIESPSGEPAAEASDKKNWTTTASAFQRLLKWLDGETNSEGQKYLEMRCRLVAYFDRKNCTTPDDLADETLNRVARRLEEENISDTQEPAKYCYIVARFVFLEHLRSSRREGALANDLLRSATKATAIFDQAQDDQNIMLTCLEGCIKGLEPESRQIIHGYYIGKEREKIENRRSLAQALGLTSNALSIRACRIRAKLEKCVRECCRGE